MKVKMAMTKLVLVSMITLLVITGCAPASSSGNSGAGQAVAKDKMMEATATPEAMMEKSDDMMKETATPETIMDKGDEMMKETPTQDAMMDKQDDKMKEGGDMMVDVPAWFNAELNHVSTGETFMISDFKGKVVLVETMAIWCSNCLRQQKEVKELHDLMGMSEDFVSVVLDIDPNEDGDSLKAYTEKNGFDWHYAVAPAEVSREISQLYGDQFLNPPSTPILLIGRDGKVQVLPFGIKSAEDLKAAVDALLKEGM